MLKAEQPPEPGQAPKLVMWVYGAGGTGKTRFLHTFDKDPRTERIWIFNLAGNPISILREEPTPYVFTVSSMIDFNEPFEFFKRGQPPEHPLREKLGIPPDVRFQTVAFDTITEMQHLINRSICGSGNRPSAFKRMEIQHWGESLELIMHTLFLYTQDLDLNVVISSQERRVEDEETKRMEILPFLRGQAGEGAPQYATIVARAVRRTLTPSQQAEFTEEPGAKTASMFFFETGGKFAAKNQLDPRLGKEMVAPTITKILDIITASKEKEN